MQEEAKSKEFYEQLRDSGADINALYTQIAHDYDSFMESFGDVMNLELTNLLEAHFPDKDSRSSLQIYQIGFGTGRMGKLLVNAGFTDIIGVQPCKALVDIVQKKGLYKTIKIRLCGTGELEPEWKDKFDVAVGCGVFAQNHVPPSGFEELIDSVKKGGVVTFPVREDEWVGLGYKEKAESLEKEGKWKLLKRIEKANWLKKEVQKIYIYFLYEKQ